jgi:hypothetical protein
MQVSQSLLNGARKMLQGVPYEGHQVLVLNDEFVGKVMYHKAWCVAMLNSTGELLIRSPSSTCRKTELTYLKGMLQAVIPELQIYTKGRLLYLTWPDSATYSYDGLCFMQSGWLNVHQLKKGAYIEYSEGYIPS